MSSDWLSTLSVDGSFKKNGIYLMLTICQNDLNMGCDIPMYCNVSVEVVEYCTECTSFFGSTLQAAT